MGQEAGTPEHELECDCGFMAHGGDEDELIVAVQVHAREVHGMNLPAELILTLAHTTPRPVA